MHRGGIDEAGYGPILGPLAIVGVWADVEDAEACTHDLRAVGVDDSKALHHPRNLGPLETVALAGATWLSGTRPATAAEFFTLVGEGAAERTLPWMQGADSLSLPIAARRIPQWSIASAKPLGVAGHLIHPGRLNRAKADGRNRAAVEWDAVGNLLAGMTKQGTISVTVDRLGGRRYYADVLATALPLCPITVIEELPACSRYQVEATCGSLDVAFRVGADAVDALVGLASCLAKYARELHQHLFNAWWGGRIPGLAPTAGYAVDAKRWIAELGHEDRQRFGIDLIRD